MGSRIVVTFEVMEQDRPVFMDVLGEDANVVFLKDAPDGDRPSELKQADVVVALSCSDEDIRLEEMPLLEGTRLIQLVYAGADKVPFDAAPKDVVVASNAGAFAEPLAEHVLAMALSLAKLLNERTKQLGEGIFDRTKDSTYLKGKICGIVGFGGNGAAIGKLMSAIGMKVYAINRTGRTDAPVDYIGTMDDLDHVLEKSDVVVLTIPLTKTTQGFIGRRELERMKDDAILINIGRGALIDQKALYEHLQANAEFRVGIDTWWAEPIMGVPFAIEHPFFDNPNVIGTPHVADHVPGMIPLATKMAFENVNDFLAGRPIRGILKREDYLG